MRCAACGTRDIVEDAQTGSMVCKACGLIIEESTISTMAPVDTSMGGHMSAVDGGASHLGNAPQGFRDESMRNSEWDRTNAQKNKALKRMDGICAQLNFTFEDREQARNLLDAYLKTRWHSNRRLDLSCAACCFLRCRMQGRAMSLAEVASAIGVAKESLYAEYQRVRSVIFEGLATAEGMFAVRAEDLPFVAKYVRMLAIPDMGADGLIRVIKIAERVYQLAHEGAFATGRNPLSLYAGAIALTVRALNYDWELAIDQLMRLTGVSRPTVDARMSEFRRSVLVLAHKLPWGKDIDAHNVDQHLVTAIEAALVLERVAEPEVDPHARAQAERVEPPLTADDEPRDAALAPVLPKSYLRLAATRERRTRKLVAARARLAAVQACLPSNPFASKLTAATGTRAKRGADSIDDLGSQSPCKRARVSADATGATHNNAELPLASASASAAWAELDEEDIEIFRLVREGVPDHAIVCGYSDATSRVRATRTDASLALLDPLDDAETAEFIRPEHEVRDREDAQLAATSELERAQHAALDAALATPLKVDGAPDTQATQTQCDTPFA